MSAPLLVEFFQALPEDALRGGLDWPVSPPFRHNSFRLQLSPPRTGGKARRRAAIHIFSKRVQERYTEGTLLRLLSSEDVEARQAAVYALGLLGSPRVNGPVAAMLHDDDEEVVILAMEALWSLWFRGDSPTHSDELYRILRTHNCEKAMAGLDALIARAPRFAEAYNQRAILYFRLEQFDRSVADGEAALRLNPHHFAAQAGLGQCYLRLRKKHAALRAFQTALRINPHLEGVAHAVRELQNTLGDSGG